MSVIWKVIQTERETTNDGVIVAHWTASDSDTVGTGDDAVTHTGNSYGSVGLTPDHTADGFIDYEDLTENNVVGWVKDSLGSEEVTLVEESIAAQIADSKAPAMASGLPWE